MFLICRRWRRTALVPGSPVPSRPDPSHMGLKWRKPRETGPACPALPSQGALAGPARARPGLSSVSRPAAPRPATAALLPAPPLNTLTLMAPLPCLLCWKYIELILRAGVHAGPLPLLRCPVSASLPSKGRRVAMARLVTAPRLHPDCTQTALVLTRWLRRRTWWPWSQPWSALSRVFTPDGRVARPVVRCRSPIRTTIFERPPTQSAWFS